MRKENNPQSNAGLPHGQAWFERYSRTQPWREPLRERHIQVEKEKAPAQKTHTEKHYSSKPSAMIQLSLQVCWLLSGFLLLLCVLGLSLGNFFVCCSVKSSLCVNGNVAGGAGDAPARVCVPFSGADKKTVPVGGGEKAASCL